MKKTLAALLAVLLLLSMTGCRKPAPAEDPASKSASTGESHKDEPETGSSEAETGDTEDTRETEEAAETTSGETEETTLPEETTVPEETILPEETTVETTLPEEPEQPEAPPHTHSYHSSVTKKATCTQKGIKTFTCACGDSYTEDIPATGHSYSSSITKKAACTQPGTKTFRCACGDSYTEDIPATGHSYHSSVTKKATCTQKGVKTFTCACGDSYTEDISATGHSWGQWVTIKKPTTEEEGSSQRTCSICSETESKTLSRLPELVTQAQLQQIRARFIELVNAERNRVGVASLSTNAYLTGWAQTRSSEVMISFSHTRPNGQSYSSIVDTTQYPWRTLGENLCMTSHVSGGYYTPADYWVGSQAQIEAAAACLFTLLKNSPGHYANMINENFTEHGVGISYVRYNGDDLPMFYLAHLFGDR